MRGGVQLNARWRERTTHRDASVLTGIPGTGGTSCTKKLVAYVIHARSVIQSRMSSWYV